MHIIMATMTFPRQLLVTVDDSTNIANVTRAIRMLRGVTAIKTATRKPRLYDPKTGEYFNDETMKAIKDVRRRTWLCVVQQLLWKVFCKIR